jgi:hypothetical protein
VPARVVGESGHSVGGDRACEVEVALLGGARPVEDQHARVRLGAVGHEPRVRQPVALAYLWPRLVHNQLRMAYAVVAIILFLLMLYMARRGLRN